jgi:hypothetical protein
MEHYASRVPKVVLVVRRGQRVSVAAKYVIELDGPEGNVFRDLDIEPATNRHREGMLAATCVYGSCRACHAVANGLDLFSVGVRI